MTAPRTLPDTVSTTLFTSTPRLSRTDPRQVRTGRGAWSIQPKISPGIHRNNPEGLVRLGVMPYKASNRRARRMIKQPAKYQDFQDPQARPRYTGIATFFRTPASQETKDVDIGIIGVPFDGGVTNRSGTRHGPRAVREQSTLLRRINSATRITPFADTRVRDLGDCWIEQPYEILGALQEIESFYRILVTAGVVPLSVGGDHAISLPILRAVAADRPVGMVHIDAHCDTGDDYMGSRFHHGAPFRRAVEEGLLDPRRVIQIGIRGTTNDPDLWGFSQRSGMRVLSMEEFDDHGWRHAAEEARRIAGGGPTYLSFDIDSLDPSQAPGTGTPEAGGITALQALRLLRELRGIDFVGGDLVEVSPPFDVGSLTAFNGASVLFEILCLLSEAWQARGTAR
jgi:guanidinopropionase